MVCNVNGVGLRPTDAIREHVLARMGAALGQYHGRVGRVWVRLRDVNGHRKGVKDKQCTVGVELSRGQQVLVRQMGEDLYSVVSRAADSVKVAVGRRLEKRKERRSVHGHEKTAEIAA